MSLLTLNWVRLETSYPHTYNFCSILEHCVPFCGQLISDNVWQRQTSVNFEKCFYVVTCNIRPDKNRVNNMWKYNWLWSKILKSTIKKWLLTPLNIKIKSRELNDMERKLSLIILFIYSQFSSSFKSFLKLSSCEWAMWMKMLKIFPTIQ